MENENLNTSEAANSDLGAVSGSRDSQEDWYDDEYYEGQPHEDCPKCGRSYDHIDFDYQSCSKCGWDAENEKWTEAREPSDDDYLNGGADILTGRWY
jgi:ribosomal protein L37E